MMSFFAPWMLLGLVAAAGPVLLHLLRRRTADRVRWGAWMFILETLQRKRRKLMIEDIVILVLRTLVLVLAALAFARPFFPELRSFGGAGMDKDVALIIDGSASMGLPDASGRSAFDRAVSEARELVRLSPKGTAFSVVLGDRTPMLLTPSPLSSKREVTELLDGLSVGFDTMDAPRSLAAAGESLSAGNNPAKEVVIFGDGQAYGWRTDDEGEWKRVERIFSRFHRRPPVVWRTLERPAQVKNAAIAAVIPSRRLIGTDRPVGFTVSVVNSGTEAFSPGDAVLSVDGVETCRAPVGQILPGLTRTFEFRHAFKKEGRHSVVASLSLADGIAVDSVVSNSVDVLGSLDVMIVDGRFAEKGFDRPSAFLAAALRPEVAGTNAQFLVRPRVMRVGDLEKSDAFRGVSAAVLCDVPMLSSRALVNLSDFVRNGGGLLTVPGESCGTGFYTNELFTVTWTNWNPRLERTSFLGAPVAGRVEFDEAALVGNIEVDERFSDGAAAVVSAPYGKGLTAVCATPLDLGWTTLPARPEFVPFVHELVARIAGTNSVAGVKDVRWRAKEGDLRPLTRDEADGLSVYIDLGVARNADDALAAVVGRDFGLEVWRPFAIIALVLLLIELFLCRMIDRERGGIIRSRVQILLRAVAFAALGWMLLHLSWSHDETRAVHRRVVVFTDESLSMKRPVSGIDRYAVATNLAPRIADGLAGRYDVEPFAFGGAATDFAEALESALERIPAEELAGAVFLTDGRSTVDDSPEAAARRFARIGAKVSTVVIGPSSNRTDAAVESLRVPTDVFLGDKVRAAVKVRADGFKGRQLKARLMEGDRLIEEREFEIASDEWSEEFRFSADPDGNGVKSYRVEIVPPEGDSEKENDVWPFEVSVNDDRTNVLIADRRPRWEFRYLRNLFYARDKSVHLQYVCFEPDRLAESKSASLPAADATREFGDAECGSLPKTRNDWRKFDIIILGDLPPEVLTPEVQEDLRYCVEERGALLVTVAGEKFMPFGYVSGTLAELMPVAFTNEAGAVSVRLDTKRVPFALTPSGLSHPVTRIASSAAESERIWSSLPPARWRLAGLFVKTGAEVLLGDGEDTAMSAPLLAVREVGCGKTAFFATDETWLLRYRTGDTYHHRFWGNLVKWGAGEKLRDGNRHVRLGTDMISYRPGDRVKLIARLSDRELLPVTDAKAVCEVKSPDGTVGRVELKKRSGVNGYYEGLFEATESEGRYSVTLAADSVRSALGDEWPAELESSFAVGHGIAPVEYARLSSSDELPKTLARLTGGKVVTPETAEDFDFGPVRGEITEHVEEALWDHPAAMIVLLATLLALWIIRKRKGLA